MDLKRLRTFVAVADLGTVSGAAEALRITQPALSRQLQELRREFGVPLFDRVGRRLRLTTEGAALLPGSRALLHQADALVERARLLILGDSGELRVGATAHLTAQFFPGLLRDFAVLFPRVKVQPVEAGGVDQVELLRHGALHAAITWPRGVEAGIITHPLPDMTIVAARDPVKGPALPASVEVRALASVPLLLLTSNYGTRNAFDAACRLERVVPNVFVESSSTETLLALACEGHGVAIIPTTARLGAASLQVSPVLVRREPMTIEIAVLWDGRRGLPRYAEAFSATLADVMRAIVPRFTSA
jgi:LysR family transcriptional regulator, nitrogen assimilation regulatory protein